MTLEEISTIKDPTIRNIRMKYWNLKHQAFLDAQNIPDDNLARLWDELSSKEEQEIAVHLQAAVLPNTHTANYRGF